MEKRHKFTVLAPEIVEQIAGMKAGAPELYLSSHALFPSGYMEYLMEVLSINRHLSVVSGEKTEADDWAGEAEVWELVKEQVHELLEGRAGSEGKAGQVLEVRRDGGSRWTCSEDRVKEIKFVMMEENSISHRISDI